VTVRTPVQTFRLKLTDEPAEAPPADEKKNAGLSGAGRALSRALGRALAEPNEENGK
jgi:hypothetical protein